VARSEFKGRQYTGYTPTPEILETWKERAKAANLSLNHYILEAVESVGEQKPTPEVDTTTELNTLRAENQQLKVELDRIRLRDAEILKRGEELRKQAESQKTFTTSFMPIPSKQAIISKLRAAGGFWTSDRINRELGIYINSGDNIDKILDELEDLGLIKETARGWQWIK
jgi:hypothetical protein